MHFHKCILDLTSIENLIGVAIQVFDGRIVPGILQGQKSS